MIVVPMQVYVGIANMPIILLLGVVLKILFVTDCKAKTRHKYKQGEKVQAKAYPSRVHLSRNTTAC